MRLVLPYNEERESYPDDISRIVKVCRDTGYTVSRSMARRIWENHSDNYAAGWLILPESDADLLAEVLANSKAVEDE